MKTRKKGIRGNNIISNTLNREIDGKLAQKQPPKFTLIVFSVLFIIILAISIYHMGLNTGTLFAIGFSICVAIAGALSEHHIKSSEKIIKKHPWRAFEDNDK